MALSHYFTTRDLTPFETYSNRIQIFSSVNVFITYDNVSEGVPNLDLTYPTNFHTSVFPGKHALVCQGHEVVHCLQLLGDISSSSNIRTFHINSRMIYLLSYWRYRWIYQHNTEISYVMIEFALHFCTYYLAHFSNM